MLLCYFFLNLACFVSVIFNRLCEMHLETESDGDSDFVAPFSYNPGKVPNIQSDFRNARF